jgi:hypothetical protein
MAAFGLRRPGSAKEIGESAVSAANVDDAGSFGQLKAMNQVEGSGGDFLSPTDFLGFFGPVDVFQMIFFGVHT